MKKYLMFAAAVIAFASCNKMDDFATSQAEIDKAKYDAAFKKYIGGEIPSNQDWGFSANAYTSAPAFDFTRSASEPTVATMNAPYDGTWINDYLTTAKEPNSTNANDNYDNSVYHEGTPGTYAANYSTIDDWDIWNSMYTHGDWDAQVAWLLANGKDYWLTYTPGTEGYWEYDENFVRNFKITGTYDGYINVVSTPGLTDGVPNGNERTVVVTGTWNLTQDQVVGAKGRIIVAEGGKINISDGVTLSSVQAAQIVVLRGGEIKGGNIVFTNGTDSDLQSYNGGTIDVAKFNNNGGDFFNYGTLNTDVMDGGAANSCYYNHGKVNVGNSGSSANIRIYNGCQWNVTGYFRLKMLENTSYFYVGGRLETIGSEDGTGQDAYVALGNNSLVKASSLHNTGTNWYGPTGSLENAYAVADFGYIYQLDWAPGAVDNGPLANGYFANNIYVNIHNQDNEVLGSAGRQTAKQVFWKVIANGQGQGNGNVTEVTDGDQELIYGDENFVAGENGCKPEYTANVPEGPDPSDVLRIICEDLSATGDSDFDFNDVVIDVTFGETAADTKIVLVAAGGTLPLRINGNNALEIHKLFGVLDADADVETITEKLPMVNTGKGPSLPSVDISSQVNVAIANAAEANTKLKLEVFKNNEWQEMKAEKGQPACKLAVDQNYKIMTERQSIKGVYEKFVDWAKGDITSKWW